MKWNRHHVFVEKELLKHMDCMSFRNYAACQIFVVKTWPLRNSFVQSRPTAFRECHWYFIIDTAWHYSNFPPCYLPSYSSESSSDIASSELCGNEEVMHCDIHAGDATREHSIEWARQALNQSLRSLVIAQGLSPPSTTRWNTRLGDQAAAPVTSDRLLHYKNVDRFDDLLGMDDRSQTTEL